MTDLAVINRTYADDPSLASVTVHRPDDMPRPNKRGAPAASSSTYRISLLDVAFLGGVGLAAVGALKLTRWNKLRLKAKEERRKALEIARAERVSRARREGTEVWPVGTPRERKKSHRFEGCES